MIIIIIITTIIMKLIINNDNNDNNNNNNGKNACRAMLHEHLEEVDVHGELVRARHGVPREAAVVGPIPPRSIPQRGQRFQVSNHFMNDKLGGELAVMPF